jgi:enoyl-CoA hydratase
VNLPPLRIDRTGAVMVVTLDRPDRRNAVDGSTARELSAAFRSFDADPALSVGVLTGAGGNFCAGFDLKALAEGTGPEVGEGDGPMGVTYLRLSKPVIAAIEGYSVAGGMELALWCDLRVAARDAVFGVFNRRSGI